MPARIGARRMEAAHTRLKGGFSLAAFMASQSDGFWYDFGQTDRLFQEQCGPTPANDPGEVIGLALSQRLWNGQTRAAYLAGQPNLASVTTQAAVAIGGPAFTNYTISSSLIAGRTYEISFDVTGYSGSGSIGIAGGVGNFEPDLTGEAISGNGTVRVYGTMQVTGAVSLFSRSTNTCTFANISIKEVSRYPATQATNSFRPTFQTTGAKFDGTDDNLLTGYTAGAGANFIVARVTIPSTLTGTQIIAGGRAATDTRFFLATNALGTIGGGVGTQGSSVITGTTDRRNSTIVIGLSFDGTTVRLFEADAMTYQAAQSGAPSTSAPLRLGALNDNGTAGAFSPVAIRSIVAGREFIDLARFNQIASQL